VSYYPVFVYVYHSSLLCINTRLQCVLVTSDFISYAESNFFQKRMKIFSFEKCFSTKNKTAQ